MPDLPQEKTCTQCQSSKPLDDFRNDKYRPDGKSSKCRLCKRGRDKERYDVNPLAPRARSAASRRKHLDERLAYEAQYRQDHPNRSKQRYQAKKLFINAQNAARHAARQFERHNGTTDIIPGRNDLSTEQVLEIRIAYAYTCQYCGKALRDGQCSIDHITPISLGGPNTLQNTVLACTLCNGKKHRGLPSCPIQPLLLTLASPKTPKKKGGLIMAESFDHLTPNPDAHSHGPLICTDCLAERAAESETERTANFEAAKAIANALLQALDTHTEAHEDTTYHQIFEGLAILHWFLQRERDEDDAEPEPSLPEESHQESEPPEPLGSLSFCADNGCGSYTEEEHEAIMDEADALHDVLLEALNAYSNTHPDMSYDVILHALDCMAYCMKAACDDNHEKSE